MWKKCIKNIFGRIVFVPLLLFPLSTGAEEMIIPAKLQVPLILKILTFDRNFESRVRSEFTIGIVYAPTNPASLKAKDEILNVLKGYEADNKTIKKLPIKHTLLEYTTESNVEKTVRSSQIDVLYIAPGNAHHLEALLNISRTHRIITVTGIPDYVEQGVAVGVGLKRSNKPQILINLLSSKFEGSAFDATLLKLAAVFQPSPLIVLVIDDDPEVGDLIKQFLSEELGCRVKTASDGEKGIQLARELHPATITVDMLMPGIDGWAVLTTLKTTPELANIPIIMLTTADDKNTGYVLDVSDYLTKPFEGDQLTMILKENQCEHPPCSVLIVEDEASIRKMMRQMLENEKWMVMEAENGRVALEHIARNRPELILVDLMMSKPIPSEIEEIDGFEFIEQLRTHEEWQSIPIVVVIGKGLTQTDRLQLNDSVTKMLQQGGYSREDLLQEVRELVVTGIH